ncbi:hypothetical protein GTZ99_15640 [Novosphingobium sp. FSY-8]|uniref:Uncharacterized protein n=1 Tax=Novosphingobium ovatum TaxID=1908523 RepID=A0ABW9XHQ1_9SPHN|nr:hypothetical protein [Novosphingobium ovatum]NBC37988.1 hypothetical protein [Novosphingobium ovatum]
MSSRSPFDDPEKAAYVWRRFRRLMAWMMLVTITVVIGAISVLYRQEGMVSIHFYIAVAIGIAFAMLLMAGLMGLVFLSNNSGHDDSVIDPVDRQD